MTAPPPCALRGIRKRFGSVQALRGADFTLCPGEVHALLGENGAGKTTLMHVAYGLVRPDAGDRSRSAAPSVRCRLRGRARRLGIGMVHQHFTSVPALTRGGERRARRGLAGARPAACASGCAALASGSGSRSIPTTPAGRLCVGAQAAARDREGARGRRARSSCSTSRPRCSRRRRRTELLRVVRALHRAGRRGGAHHPQAGRGARRGGPGDGAAAGRGRALSGPAAGTTRRRWPRR